MSERFALVDDVHGADVGDVGIGWIGVVDGGEEAVEGDLALLGALRAFAASDAASYCLSAHIDDLSADSFSIEDIDHFGKRCCRTSVHMGTAVK